MADISSTVITNARKVDSDGIVDDFWLRMADAAIVETGTGRPPVDETGEVIDADGGWLTPGFIDLHCHGGGGASFDDGADAIREALATHRAHGTTRSLISLVSGPVETLTEALQTIADLTRTDPLILGSHLEGPFLSPLRRGAHDPDALITPDADLIGALLDAAEGTLRQITIAPELPGAAAAIDTFIANGVRVAVGHTDADYGTAREAFDHGATLLTHAFNAMHGVHHRAPGPVIAAFDDERVTLELILDGRHVHPRVAAMAFAAAPGRIALVTDAMAAAGSHGGSYRIGSLDVEVRDGQALLAGTDTLAGSTLTQDGALRRALSEVGVSPVEAVTALTSTPARALGLESRLGALAPGYAADIVLLDADWTVERVWANGSEVPR